MGGNMRLRNKKTGEIASTSGDDVDLFILDEFNRIVHETYSSLAELNEEWEDYEPKEPLIKDEKVRKAVRAWASVIYHWTDESDIIRVRQSGEWFYDFVMFDFELQIPTFQELEEGDYTLAELCGEEE